MVIKMLADLWRRVEKYGETFSKELENTRMNQSEQKNVMTKTR